MNNARIKNKRDTTENWNSAVGFIPLDGEIIIYTDYKTIEEDGVVKYIPGIKIGTGNAYVQDLAFIDDELRDSLLRCIDSVASEIMKRIEDNYVSKNDPIYIELLNTIKNGGETNGDNFD